MDDIKIMSPEELKNLSDGYLDEYITQLNEYMLDGMDPGDLEQFRQAMKEARALAAERKAAREALEEQQRLEQEAEEERLRKEKEEAEKNKEGNGWERDTYIDTTYGLQTLDEDQSSKGSLFLILSAMLTVFYFAFSIPYWYRILHGLSLVNEKLGASLPPNILYVHLGLAAAALILNVIAIFSGKTLFAMFASFLYALAILPAPAYMIYVGLQSLFCLFGGLSKHAGKAITKVLKALTCILALAIVVLTGLVRFDFITSAQVPYMDTVLSSVQKFCSNLLPGMSGEEEETELSTEWYNGNLESIDWENESEWTDEDWEDESEWLDEGWEDESEWLDESWEDESEWLDEDPEDGAEFSDFENEDDIDWGTETSSGSRPEMRDTPGGIPGGVPGSVPGQAGGLLRFGPG